MAGLLPLMKSRRNAAASAGGETSWRAVISDCSIEISRCCSLIFSTFSRSSSSSRATAWCTRAECRATLVICPSEPEAVLGRDKCKVFRPLYNVQLARDLESPLILGFAVLPQTHDAGCLGLLPDRAQRLGGHAYFPAGHRLTMPEVHELIERGTGWLKKEHFHPVPCSHPSCYTATYLFLK